MRGSQSENGSQFDKPFSRYFILKNKSKKKKKNKTIRRVMHFLSSSIPTMLSPYNKFFLGHLPLQQVASRKTTSEKFPSIRGNHVSDRKHMGGPS
jgi:hypothetical protein